MSDVFFGDIWGSELDIELENIPGYDLTGCTVVLATLGGFTYENRTYEDGVVIYDDPNGVRQVVTLFSDMDAEADGWAWEPAPFADPATQGLFLCAGPTLCHIPTAREEAYAAQMAL